MNFSKLHILLACNLGASTGVMVARMEEVVKNSEKLKDKDILISAHPAGELEEYIDKFDVVLIGPQISHRFEELKQIADAHGKPIEIINSQDYGTVNGGNIIKAAILLKLNNQ
ncbi:MULTISPECIES: PTS sugar transporter subunit IIB [Vagococcus]|uniref:PTS sugar transporter subunit IIB n=1 Tax=Vagococcus TaxID=2737 RepID=UPI002FC93C56